MTKWYFLQDVWFQILRIIPEPLYVPVILKIFLCVNVYTAFTSIQEKKDLGYMWFVLGMDGI